MLLPLISGTRRGLRSVDALASHRLSQKNSVNEDGVDKLPRSKLQKPFKGAISHLEYQDI